MLYLDAFCCALHRVIMLDMTLLMNFDTFSSRSRASLLFVCIVAIPVHGTFAFLRTILPFLTYPGRTTYV